MTSAPNALASAICHLSIIKSLRSTGISVTTFVCIKSSKSPPKNSSSVKTDIPAAPLLYDATTGSTSSFFVLNQPLLGLFLLNSAMMPLLPGNNKFSAKERLAIFQKKPSFSNRSTLLIGLNFSTSFLFAAMIVSKIVLIVMQSIYLMIHLLSHYPGFLLLHDKLCHTIYTCQCNVMPLQHLPAQQHSAQKFLRLLTQ